MELDGGKAGGETDSSLEYSKNLACTIWIDLRISTRASW